MNPARMVQPFRRGVATRVFICYRRDGAGAGYALDLRNRLATMLGQENVFLDVAAGAIAVGDNWQRNVSIAIDQSTAIVIVIDARWSERLAAHDDPVRFEISEALADRPSRTIRLFPVLVGDARMPNRAELPVSIAGLADAHAAHIRTATADSDVNDIVRHLTGRRAIQGLAGPDRYDGAIMAAAFVLSVAVWGSFFRNQFNTKEKWLWGTAIVLLAIELSALRWTVAAWRLGATARIRRMLTVLVVLTSFASGVVYAGYQTVYRVPQFLDGGTGGFLIARFNGDSHDMVRSTFATQLARIIIDERIDRYLGVSPDNIPHRRLEQRLGLLSDPANPLILLLPRRVFDGEEADAYAKAAHAGIILWGSRRVEGELDISVLFAPGTDAIDDPVAGVVGSSDIHEISRKPVGLVEVGRLQKALVWLLAGYRKYHAARPNYENALASFESGLKVLDDVSDEQQKGLIGAIKATLYLYSGNVLLFRGDLDGASRAYRLAEELSTVGNSRMFVEPVNNLAYLERARGNSYPIGPQRNGTTAREQLETVTPDCSVEATQMSAEACAYVWYNLGATFHDEADTEDDDARARSIYTQAAEYFDNTVALLDAMEAGRDHREHARLLAETYQNQAYGLAKQAELSSDTTARDLEAIARKSEEAAGALRRYGMPVPLRYSLTPARVRLMRREWGQAVADLKKLRASETYAATFPLWSKAELQLLLAAAQICGGHTHESEVSLITYRELAGSLPNPDRAQFREVQEIPRLTRNCKITPDSKL